MFTQKKKNKSKYNELTFADKMAVTKEITATNLDYRWLVAKYQRSTSQNTNIMASKEKKVSNCFFRTMPKCKRHLVMWKWKFFKQLRVLKLASFRNYSLIKGIFLHRSIWNSRFPSFWCLAHFILRKTQYSF